MENASKALLMAAGVLVGILILALMITMFLSSRDLSSGYEKAKSSEALQQFNVNFTKYIGQELNINQVVTICNFALENGINKSDITGNIGYKNENNILEELEKKSKYKQYGLYYYYVIQILNYGEDGKVSKIKIDYKTRFVNSAKKSKNIAKIVHNIV